MEEDYREIETFTTAIQEVFPKLMHYLETEEIRELTGLGITPGQVNALLILFLHDDLTMGELSSEIYLAESAATRLVDRLVKLNLVRRKGDEKDRRVVRVYLTSYGRQLANLVFQRRSLRFRNLAERISANEREMLITSMRAVLRVFEAFEIQAANNPMPLDAE
ncbi:MAG: MarR family transcriptional regulator [Dethiobacter sp.]|jgi:DNA-binding MarR family transcriptional regulator|nr:MarR family transcriptional regulator [Dethiobacter sp.]